MGNEEKVFSTNITNGMVSRRSNIFIEKIVRIFFHQINFDKESIATLNEYQDKGRVVYVSYQSSNLTLFILLSLLRRHGFGIPVLALDFSVYLLQNISTVIKKIILFIRGLFHKIRVKHISDFDYLRSLISGNKSIAFSLLSKKFFLKRYLEVKYDTLQYLVEIQKTSETPIFLFPQILFWNRNPERTRSFVASSATGDRGLINAFIVLFKSATPAFMRISPPVNLKEEIADYPTEDSRTLARMIRNKLLENYSIEKRSVLGPVIKTEQEMLEKVLYHKNVLDAINEQSSEDHVPVDKLRKKAYRYFREIAADFSIVYVRIFERALNYVYHKIFDGIIYQIEDLKKVREAMEKGPAIIIPSHRSHMDYLIISCIFFKNKIIPPHILAGANLSFFPMGKIFRRSGAFFMRRSFKGLKLYPVVFRQYIKTLVNEGYSIEFFIEGSRSRSGKQLFPKMGMLKYLIESIEEGYNRDMVFIPISINYDRILEESSYSKELKGKEKKTESTSAIMKSRKLLKRKYGRVYLSFNEPVSIHELKEKFGDCEDFTEKIGYYISRKISEVVVVTPFSVATMAILLASAKGFTKDILREKMNLIVRYLSFARAKVADVLLSGKDIEEAIDYVIQSYQQDGIINQLIMDEKTGESDAVFEGLYILKEEDRPKIAFYKNSIIHYLLPVAFVANAILNQDEKTITRGGIVETYHELKNLFTKEFVYQDYLENAEEVADSVISFFEKESVLKQESSRVIILNGKRDILNLFAKVLRELFESYIIVLTTILETKEKMNKKDFILNIRKSGVKMFHLGDIVFLESLSMQNYNNALLYFMEAGLLKEEQISKKIYEIKILNSEKARENLAKIKGYLAKIS